MAAFMLNNASVTINSVDLSDHVTSVTFTEEADKLETNAMGEDNRTMIGGLTSGHVDHEFNQFYISHESEEVGGANNLSLIVPKTSRSSTGGIT